MKCYLSEDGLSGFAVEPDGNLISVFSLRTGSLKAMRSLEGRAWYNKVWNTIKELYRDFMRKHGWYNARLDGLDKMSPDEAATP